jgi:hypothetical protein
LHYVNSVISGLFSGCEICNLYIKQQIISHALKISDSWIFVIYWNIDKNDTQLQAENVLNNSTHVYFVWWRQKSRTIVCLMQTECKWNRALYRYYDDYKGGKIEGKLPRSFLCTVTQKCFKRNNIIVTHAWDHKGHTIQGFTVEKSSSCWWIYVYTV